MNETNTYGIITRGDGIDYQIYWVEGVDEKDALIKFCKYTCELSDIKLDAIRALSFVKAVTLTNEWLADEILNIHVVGKILFVGKHRGFDIIS